MKKFEGFKVNGKPFFVIGAQAHNSSSYSREMFGEAIKAALALNCNTLEAPIYWEKIEPQEGKYDFAGVDYMLEMCRENNLRLIILWFATWKNGEMSYVPEFVKKEQTKFQRVLGPDRLTVANLSAHYSANQKADAKAFSVFMDYLKKTDSKEQTVLAVQVENEAGFLRTDRDYSPQSLDDLKDPVPERLLKYLETHTDGVPYQDWNKHGLKKGSNWVETFGYHGYEFCEAWYLAAYIDKVAAAGKAKYDLPMYVNVWTSFSAAWGVAGVEFPCGGPGPRTFEIWLAAVEYLDIIAPDNYEQNSYRFEVQCDFFNRGENTLFIPESSKNITGACNMFYAIAHGAVGYSCFGAESCIDSEGNLNELGIPIRDTNFGVQRVIPLIVKHRNTGRMYPVVKKHDGETDRFFEFEEFIGNVTLVNPVLRNDQSRPDYINKRDMVPPELAVPRGLIIEDEDRVFYLAGRFNLRLIAKRSSEVLKILQHLPLAEFLSVEEGHFNDNGIFTTDRIRNGDEVYFCGFWVTPRCGVVRIKLL